MSPCPSKNSTWPPDQAASRCARRPLSDAIVGAEEIRLSVVCPWELVIKSALGEFVLHRGVEGLTVVARDQAFADYGIALVKG